ncbi:hypothetical protein J3F83DRAFT_142181 [Trichoderma novae-zelandiae]
MKHTRISSAYGKHVVECQRLVTGVLGGLLPWYLGIQHHSSIRSGHSEETKGLTPCTRRRPRCAWTKAAAIFRRVTDSICDVPVIRNGRYRGTVPRARYHTLTHTHTKTWDAWTLTAIRIMSCYEGSLLASAAEELELGLECWADRWDYGWAVDTNVGLVERTTATTAVSFSCSLLRGGRREVAGLLSSHEWTRVHGLAVVVPARVVRNLC